MSRATSCPHGWYGYERDTFTTRAAVVLARIRICTTLGGMGPAANGYGRLRGRGRDGENGPHALSRFAIVSVGRDTHLEDIEPADSLVLDETRAVTARHA